MSDPNTPDPYQQSGGSGPPPPPGSNPDPYGSAGQPPAPDSSGYGAADQSYDFGATGQPGYGAPDQSGYGSQDPQGGYGGQNPSGPPPPAGGYTSPTGYQPDPEPKKSRGTAVLAAVIALIVGIGLGIGGGFLIWGGSDDEAKPAASATPTESEEPSEAPETDAPTVDPTVDPTEEESEEPVAPATTDAPARSGDEGTRKNPLPVGTETTIGDWTLILDTPKDGTEAIAKENQFNDPPEDGFEFYLVPMTATYNGDESANAWADLRVQFVGDDGRTYRDYCGVFPDDISSVGEMYEGAVAEGNACVSVPAGADGLWTVTGFMGDPVFFSAK